MGVSHICLCLLVAIFAISLANVYYGYKVYKKVCSEKEGYFSNGGTSFGTRRNGNGAFNMTF
jgi:hypothetical protein